MCASCSNDQNAAKIYLAHVETSLEYPISPCQVALGYRSHAARTLEIHTRIKDYPGADALQKENA